MRRAIAPLVGLMLLASLLWQWGYVSTFDLRLGLVKQAIKLRLKAGVPDEERVHFSFSPEEVAELVWVKPDREFRWKGRFYDVVERATDATGRIQFACIDDRQETELFAELGTMVERSMDTRSDGRSSSAKIIASWKGLSPDTQRTSLQPSSCHVVHVPVGSTLVLTAHRAVEEPPPEV